MLRNYFKTAIRSLMRHRFFSAINIFGLAIAMTICMGIIMLVADQLSYDRYNTNRNRIYRVTSVLLNGGVPTGNENATSPQPLAAELKNNYTGIELVVRLRRGFANPWIEFEQDVNIPIHGFFADPGVLEMFQLEMEYGDPTTALNEPFSVVITRKAAKKLFKEENPVGQTIKVGDKGTYTVTGVLRDTDHKSHIVFEALASMASVRSLEAEGKFGKELDNWTNFWNAWTYVMVEEGKDEADVQQALDKIQQTHIAPITNPDITKGKFSLQPLTDISPGKFLNNPIGPFLPWVFIYFLGGLAALVMLTSCFNFTNLSIARSLTRAKEIGVRKVSGAARWQIFLQFLTEAVVTSLFALGLAMILLTALKPLMLQLNFARILKWDLESNLVVYGVFLAFAILVGLLAGLFPATVLSGFQPVKVLKNLGTMKLFSRMGLRKALLVSQFTLSLIFILSVIVVYNQLKLFVQADHGFSMEKKMVVRLNNTKPEALKTELLKYPEVVSVTAVSHLPAAGTTYGEGFKKSLADKDWTTINYFAVDEDYLKNLDLELVAGRYFLPTAGESNKNFMVVNEEVVKAMQYGSNADALGQELIMQRDSVKREIIGVVRNYNHEVLMSKIGPMALLYSPEELRMLQVKYAGDFKQASKSVESAWAKVNPAFKVDYKDMEDEVRGFYKLIFGDIVTVVAVVAALAIVISCLGLLGMATYATETRIKEISIRKVLGSSNQSLVYLLSKGFLFILAIAIVLAVPAAYFINHLWLDMIAYHVNVDVPTVVLGVFLLVVFGVVTIGSQTWRATFINPVENLKSE
jgi:putative ABC transport system permease protein